MRRVLVALVLVGVAVPVASARAAWSRSPAMANASNPSQVVVATDARGDAAVAWVVSRGARPLVTSVRVAVRRGRSGAWLVRLVRSARDLRVGGLALAMAPTGEVTVAWIEQLGGGHRTVRAAYRTPAGLWSSLQAVAYASPFAYAYPRLAVASDGTVALVYNAGVRAAPGMAAAWRAPGHPFGSVTAVPGGQLSQPTLAFDPARTLFLAGTALCNNEAQSHGVVLQARAGSRRFGKPRTITPRPATELRLVMTGAGRSVASWIGAGCSTSELLSGPLNARRVGSTGAGPVKPVSGSYANDLQLIPAFGGVDVTFTGYAGSPAGAVFLAHLNSDGTGLPPQVPADGWMPIAGDASGDQLLQTAIAQSAGQPRAAAVRRAHSMRIEQSPIAGPAWWTAASSTTGRSLIVATTLVGTLRVATWTP